jgi:hypothetical protein
MMKIRTAAVCALTVASTGCDLVPGLLPEVEANLPPLQSIFIPTPSQTAADNTEEQAVCADGNDVATGIEARIAALNASIEGERALLDALYAAQPTGAGNIVTYTVEAGGRSLNVQLVVDEEDVVLTANIDVDTVFISGTYKQDGSEGAIAITPAEGDAIASVWSTDENGALNIARTEGEGAVAAVFNDGADQDTLAVSGTGEGVVTLVAVWNVDGSGAAIEGTEEAGCWSAGTAVADLCNVTCEQQILDALPEIPGA